MALDKLRTFWYRGPLHRALMLVGRVPASIHAQVQEPWPGDSAHGRLLIDGRFVWNGTTAQLARPRAPGGPAASFNWAPTELPTEGRAHLHGFTWLRDLRATGGEAARAAARARIADWIATQSGWASIAFRPDVIAARVAAWLAHYEFLALGGDPTFEASLRQSLARQARHLWLIRLMRAPAAARIDALKGLIYAEALLFGPGKRLTQALGRLESELGNQVRPDGGHVSRSPERQLAVLRDLIDIRLALRAAAADVPESLTQAIDRMAPMLRFFRHGDGALALFNDSHEGESWLIDVVLTQSEARGKPLGSAPHTGFERVQAGRAMLLLDAGAPEPRAADCAFAGTLSFEFGVGKERLVVNCGAGPAEDPRWGAALRATAAHSTLSLAEANSTEIAFTRMGAKYGRRVRSVTGTRDEADGAVWIERSHNGYASRFGFLHNRKLYVAAGGDDVRGEDTLAAAPDVPARKRRKPRPFAIRFHLHPGVQTSMLQDGGVLLRLPSGIGWRFAARGGAIRIDESIYFGAAVPRRTRQLVVEGTTSSEGALVKWAFRRVPERGTEPQSTAAGADT
ncbi:MAG: heparinase II/III family protein [Gemmatimonas sp.]